MNVHHFLCFLFSLLFLLFVPSLTLNLDGTLLLSFKHSILNDPLSLLANWDYTNETPCSWTGVTCSHVETSIGRVINLVLPKSKLFGSIPEDLGLIQHLQTLDLSNNFLNGTLPKSLFNASKLQVLDLSNNELSGEIPRGFDEVEILDLSSNLLNGSLPMEFGGEKLRFLNFSSNKLSGLISSKFAEKIPEKCTIDLSFNNLSGEIPKSMSFSNQKTESFAGNVQLCGKPLKKLCSIPSTLSKPPHSSSPAIAIIPKTHPKNPTPNPSETTNSHDQNQNQQQEQEHGLKPGLIAGIIVGDLACIGVLALVILYIYQLRIKKKRENDVSSSWSCLKIKNLEETSSSDKDDDNTKNQDERTLTMFDEERSLDIETLFKASAYILGASGGSIVYKAVLEDGTSYAVRRIGENGDLLRLKEFESEVRDIGKMKHKNLVKVRGFYWANDEKLLICHYVCNGSLENGGYRKIGPSPCHTPFDVRLKIARGVARGLTYIHDKKHVHGNIKPSNILLNQEMEPIITDFGLQSLIHRNPNRKSGGSLARHFGSKCPISSDHDQPVHAGVFGCTSPYHAPESHRNFKPDPKWDVYSFGILLLELLTGKGYSDQELRQCSSNTTTGSIEDDKNRILRMVDVAIRDEVQDSKMEITLGFFKLGFSCASLNPQKRPSMKYVTQILENFPCSK